MKNPLSFFPWKTIRFFFFHLNLSKFNRMWKYYTEPPRFDPKKEKKNFFSSIHAKCWQIFIIFSSFFLIFPFKKINFSLKASPFAYLGSGWNLLEEFFPKNDSRKSWDLFWGTCNAVKLNLKGIFCETKKQIMELKRP